MANVRKKAEDFLKQVPLSGDVTSNGSTAALFTKLTGSSHATLQATWKQEDVAKKARRDAGNNNMAGLPTTTTCNAFVGQLSNAIGSPIYLGQFDIEQKLKKAGFGDAWIPANSGKRPGYGDVFRPLRFHMGVSLDFIGDLWNTVESGQGGPGQDYTKGFDIIRRKQQKWEPTTLQGWVDIEILIKIATKAPPWMVGWWRFEVNATQQFIWLPERGSAQSFDQPPPNAKLAPTMEGKKGEIDFDADAQGVTIIWTGNPVPDALRRLPGVDYMLGNRGGVQIQAYKLIWSPVAPGQALLAMRVSTTKIIMRGGVMRCSAWMAVLMSLLLAGCAGSIQPEERQPQGFQPWSDDLPVYGFMPGDELDVKLLYNPEFSDRVIVAPDGYIQLALIGPVRALDRSPAELTNELRQRYAVELRRPDLSVVPRQFGSEIIYVGGEVQRPGVFKLAYRMGVLESILQAGGFLDTARTDQVVLIRRTCQNQPMLKVVNVRQMLEGQAGGDVPLHRFDVVFVPRSSVAEVNLWIDQYINRNLPFSRSFSYTINRDIGDNNN